MTFAWRTLATMTMLFASAGASSGQTLPRGAILDDVKCASDGSQSYALYVPSSYTPDRQWSVVFGFHPAARGRAIVEKYAAAAERYGYIVAASNNSRNGPWAVSLAAAQAMPADVGRRFAIDPKRVYLTGFSGGARVAFQVALAGNEIAGIIASSAGLPDSKPRSRLAFPVFLTAGIEDFNYLEMRLLDRKLTTPHHLAVFDGGHGLPPDSVAVEAIEWMELQAIKSGIRPRDEALIDHFADARRIAMAAAPDPTEAVHELEAFVSDFEGLRDVRSETARLSELRKQPDVKKALDRERSMENAEERTITNLLELEGMLGDADRMETLSRLRDELARLSRAANAPEDSPARAQARRVLRLLTAGANQRVKDREYLEILERYRLPAAPPR